MLREISKRAFIIARKLQEKDSKVMKNRISKANIYKFIKLHYRKRKVYKLIFLLYSYACKNQNKRACLLLR